MASRPRRVSDLRSGGKIVRPRRTAASKTPYDRPPPPNSTLQNPNWLSRLILSPTRMIATGAGKVISSVFGSDTSSSSSGDDFTSEDDMDDANDDINTSRKDLPIEWKSETKRAIERLLLQETFSREECDRLTYIIRSRVVDSSITGGIDGRLSEIPDGTVGDDVDMNDLQSTAVTEAKKWLKEKKMGVNSKPELECEPCTLNTAMLPHKVDEVEAGSPVDLAKSYMQERPPWASPSMSNVRLQSPSRMGTQGTRYVLGSNSVSSSKLIRESPATDSWNITEEIRKVRSRATEEMLRTRRSSVLDWSTFASDDKMNPSPPLADKIEPVSHVSQDDVQNEVSIPDPAISVPEQNQDQEGRQNCEEAEEELLNKGQRLPLSEDTKPTSQRDGDIANEVHKDSDGIVQPSNCIVGGDNLVSDSRSNEVNHSIAEEIVGNDTVVANGFPPSGSSLLVTPQLGEEMLKPTDEQYNNGDPGNNNTATTAAEKPENLNESQVQGPITNENDSVATGSQNSSSMQQEGVSPAALPMKRKAGKTKDNDLKVTEKQQIGGKRRYVRKAKGRGGK